MLFRRALGLSKPISLPLIQAWRLDGRCHGVALVLRGLLNRAIDGGAVQVCATHRALVRVCRDARATGGTLSIQPPAPGARLCVQEGEQLGAFSVRARHA
jgi:hypothetical protein